VSEQISIPNVALSAIRATGDSRVDSALTKLQNIEQLDVNEHSEIYSEIHTDLSAALSDTDS
jgi:hypothetical protein